MLRPTPVQTTGWGWPQTSGLSAVEAFLSWERLDHPDEADRYSEQLVRMTHMPTIYHRPPATKRPRSRDQLGLPTGPPLYMCNQTLVKWQPAFDGLLRDLLEADPAARLLVIAGERRGPSDAMLQRLRTRLGPTAERLIVLSWMDRERYLEVLHAADVLLDTRPYGAGANTVADALAVGRPLVTWPAAMHQSRWSAAVFERLAIPGLAVASAEQFVARTVELGHDSDQRAALHQQLIASGEQFFDQAATLAEHREWWLNRLNQG